VNERVWVIGGVILTVEDRSTKRAPCQKCPTKTPHEVAWDRTASSRAED